MTKPIHEITTVYNRRKMSTMQPTKQLQVITKVYNRRNFQPSRAATARLHRQNEAQCATHRLKGYRSSRSHRTSFTKLTNLFKTSNSLHTSLSFLLVPIKRPTGYQTAHSRHQDLSLLNAQFQECQDMRFRSSHDFLHTSLSFCQLKDQLGIELLVFYVKISHYLMHNFKYSVQ